MPRDNQKPSQHRRAAATQIIPPAAAVPSTDDIASLLESVAKGAPKTASTAPQKTAPEPPQKTALVKQADEKTVAAAAAREAARQKRLNTQAAKPAPAAATAAPVKAEVVKPKPAAAQAAVKPAAPEPQKAAFAGPMAAQAEKPVAAKPAAPPRAAQAVPQKMQTKTPPTAQPATAQAATGKPTKAAVKATSLQPHAKDISAPLGNAARPAAGPGQSDVESRLAEAAKDKARAVGIRKAEEPKSHGHSGLSAFGRIMAKSGGYVFKNPFIRAVGNMLYQLGFFAECKIVQFCRVLRDAAIILAQVLKWMFGGIASSMGEVLLGVWHDLTEPFVRMGRGVVNIFRLIKKENRETAREYFRTGLRKHAHLLGNWALFLLPLAAALVGIFVVRNMLDMKYALAVSVNDDVIGYVADQSVFEDAKNILRSRLRLSDDQQMADWQLNADLTLAKADTFTSKDQIVNEALRSGAFDVVPATGLYIDGKLEAVTTEGERLSAFLEDTLEAYKDPSMPEAEVHFVEPVTCEVNPDDIYLAESVESYDDVVAKLTRIVEEEKRYTTVEGDTLESIALANNITLEALEAKNPDYLGLGPEYMPEANTSLLIKSAEPFLQVESVVRFESTEAIPFSYVEENDPDRAKGIRTISQQGQEGEQVVYDDYIYRDGELVSKTRVDELTEVVTPAVDEVTVVGTGDIANLAGEYNGSYINPIPTYEYSSRGMSGGHRGRDYNAPMGTPIYAANGGTVVTATYHYSWGNMVLIQHADGYQTLYAHMDYISVSAGQAVAQGQPVGAVGMTGNTSGPHLHLEVWAPGGGLVDPDTIVPLH